MAVDSYLKLDKLKGESIVKGFEDQIQVNGWSWGMIQSGTTHKGTGGGSGRVDVSDMQISKKVDTASPALADAACRGVHFEEAVLTMRKAGGKEALDYLIITMEDVIVTSLQFTGGEGADEVYESLALNFAKYTFSYQPQKEDGSKKGGAIDTTYDIAKNA